MSWKRAVLLLRAFATPRMQTRKAMSLWISIIQLSKLHYWQVHLPFLFLPEQLCSDTSLRQSCVIRIPPKLGP
jgi:hypothetical protein